MYWNDRKILLARESANARARASVISVGRIAEEEASILGTIEENDCPGGNTSTTAASNTSADERGRVGGSPNTGTSAVSPQTVHKMNLCFDNNSGLLILFKQQW
ncbi:hypothetical protein BDB00DRAFT_787788 [Zychaea mexicana]|uniref:uncharacterized protein n=1 Tax=Zychaea mexicana TaxID=64656 RepID=UPI0022FEAC8E|nr:uncharacterized protein BDB00DRAFT_787788 [Zychaea mexicana]KAI9493684.1 hypothetical protein BDB00DRAFT_787788 [Zychaea mexicana]